MEVVLKDTIISSPLGDAEYTNARLDIAQASHHLRSACVCCPLQLTRLPVP